MSITIVGGGNPSGPTFPVQRSVRLRSSASAYFTRTPATTTSQTIFTFSAWVKLGNTTANRIYVGRTSTNFPAFGIAIGNNGITTDQYTTGGATQFLLATTQVFRDPSSWYHVVFAYDTTQATASNRVKIYVNGVQVTTFSTASYPAQNLALNVNTTNTQIIGADPANSGYFDGYLAEINLIDGQALTPTSFGAYNSFGVWSPAKYSGSYGTNGFYLNFQDNSGATATTIGKDSSGNGNNWTPNNISVTAGVTYDSMLDVPTLTNANNANFCVLNPLAASTATTPTQGNLYLGNNAVNNFGCVATFGVSSGKWYWEVKPDSSYVGIGVTSLSFLPANTWPGSIGSQALAYYSINGQKYNNGTNSAYGATFSSADLMGIALDMDAGTLTFYKNNVSQGTAFTGLSGTYFPVIGGPNTYNTGYINFGQRPFTYTPPTGFKSLNTFNLPTPTIPNGAAQFAATLYTGNGTGITVLNSANTTTGVSFQPDFVWMKNRGAIADHALYDSLRTAMLSSNTTAAEVAASNVVAYNSNGFTISGGDSRLNANTNTYVGWQWKAGGTPATVITGASIPSVVSVNKPAGFSIVTYTGNGTGALASVGHGLGVAPRMFIVKNRGSATNWPVYHASLPSAAYYLLLNTTAASATDIGYWGSTPPDSGQFYIYGTSGSYTNISGANYVAYCFAEIAGFSKFGSYTGNASADGPFVYTGMRPRWVMIKNASAAGNGWIIIDTSRSTYNQTTFTLFPNSSGAETNNTTYALDILSNGFKVRATDPAINGSTNTLIYAAFAENPFNYSLAR